MAVKDTTSAPTEIGYRVKVTEFAPADFCKRVLADEGRPGSARYAGDADLIISQLADILLPGEFGPGTLSLGWLLPWNHLNYVYCACSSSAIVFVAKSI